MRFRFRVVRAAITAAQDNNQAMVLRARYAPRKQWVRATHNRHRTNAAAQLLDNRRKPPARFGLV
jgi:hypothetical protein